jgi:endonuclease-3
MNKKEKLNVIDILYKTHPNAKCELNYNTPFELLIATMLSAQTTDKKVNQVTSKMFKKYNTAFDFSKIDQNVLEMEIREIGLYKNKAKNIIAMSKVLCDEYDGIVPKDKESLVKLAGVGPKTANVVLSNAFNIPAMAVDTHVFRVSNRIGLVECKNVESTEEKLKEIIPKEDWIKAHHTFIFHGRRICKAIKPLCEECPINKQCKFNKEKK